MFEYCINRKEKKNIISSNPPPTIKQGHFSMIKRNGSIYLCNIYSLFKKSYYQKNLQSTSSLDGVDKKVNNTVGVTEFVTVPIII